jgi:hypothetical protein
MPVPAHPATADPSTERVTGLDPTSARLVTAVAALISTDLAGGLLAIHAGVNGWSTAWSGSALLAAPWPMMLAQVGLTWIAVRTGRRRGAAAAALLAMACAVSVLSGFFDGGLRNPLLTPPLVAFQAGLLAVTAVVGGLAVARLRGLIRRPVARPADTVSPRRAGAPSD